MTRLLSYSSHHINSLKLVVAAAPLTSFIQIIESACEELKTFVDDKLADAGTCEANDILREVRQLQFQLNVTREYKMYIAMCGIFGSHRNIVKHWDAFQSVFTQLVSQEEDNGDKHLF